ncbi:ComEC/Rec2 family competence protein [Paraburkholderia kururiensis]|uniref:ComEC/Rec2 family competence protein n=1 Tax=Paraburkholderia kururiensis TaxID=984307 RepID=A0ABZ0WJG5_9BURK|nr:ComEC/Rec2 family competence protein [Paraburkholderia kururiensis]WQD77503.1 ComEC/Rec2 family competence protein [Paraburkholderia kururiensis]
MRAVWCGFALGVVGLQQQAALPGWHVVMACLLMAATAAVGASAMGRKGRGRVVRAGGWCAVWIAAACIGFVYAAWRAETRLAYELPKAWEVRDVELQGYIENLPATDATGVRFQFAVESPALAGRAAEPQDRAVAKHFARRVQLSWIARDAPVPVLEPGQRWRLTVRLKRPHGTANFGVRDAEAALIARNVRATGYVSATQNAQRLPGDERGVGIAFERARMALRDRIVEALGDAPHRGIVVALANGAQDLIGDDDWRLMRRTGTSHLVAVSGLHIGLVAGMVGWLVAALWRRSCFVGRDWPLVVPAQKVAVVGGALAAAVYAGLAGFNVPAQRALWMLAVIGLAFLSGRQVGRSTALAWALGIVLLIDPWAVLSAGFWLSFGAVVAIFYAMSRTVRRREASTAIGPDDAERDATALHSGEDSPRRIAWFAWLAVFVRRMGSALGGWLREGAHVQFAVTIALAPLTALWFAQIPLVGPLANAFAIPWVSVVVTPVVLVGCVLPAPLDAPVFRVAHELLVWLAVALEGVSRPSWALLHVPMPGPWALAAAAAGVLWCLAPRGWPLRWAAPLTWLPLLVPPPSGLAVGAFRLTALDIGQGSSVLIETAQHALLFDAGPGPESTRAGERVVVPYLDARGLRRLDTLVLSHDDSDHSGGAAAVLDGVEVGQVLAAVAPSHPLWTAARAAGAQTVQCAAGQRWQWDGVDFEMLWPDPGPLRGKTNEHCCVLRVTAAVPAGSAPGMTAQAASDAAPARNPPPSALLSADADAQTERTLIARDRSALRAQVLVVPHHGSATSSTEPFLDSVEPLVAIFQVGYRNRFHHPNPRVLARYEARETTLTRSDVDGAVRLDVAFVRPDDASGQGQHPTAPPQPERYRETHRRYWMDR